MSFSSKQWILSYQNQTKDNLSMVNDYINGNKTINYDESKYKPIYYYYNINNDTKNERIKIIDIDDSFNYKDCIIRNNTTNQIVIDCNNYNNREFHLPLNLLKLDNAGIINNRNSAITNDIKNDIVFFGPGITLDKGNYEITINFEIYSKQKNERTVGFVQCYRALDNDVLDKKELIVSDNRNYEIKLCFNLEETKSDVELLCQLNQKSELDIIITDITISVEDY